MIFKQIDEILSGRKTQTRRLVKPGHHFQPEVAYDMEAVGPEGVYLRGFSKQHPQWSRVHWAIGRTYAVVPKRGWSAVWWVNQLPPNSHKLLRQSVHKQSRAAFAEQGWQPLRIRITAIRREPLQAITEADALAEGVGSVAEYAALWDSINRRKGARFADSPDVWVLTFEVVK